MTARRHNVLETVAACVFVACMAIVVLSALVAVAVDVARWAVGS